MAYFIISSITAHQYISEIIFFTKIYFLPAFWFWLKHNNQKSHFGIPSLSNIMQTRSDLEQLLFIIKIPYSSHGHLFFFSIGIFRLFIEEGSKIIEIIFILFSPKENNQSIALDVIRYSYHSCCMENNDHSKDTGYKLYKNKEDCFNFEIPFNCKEIAFSEQKIQTASGSGKMKSYITENNKKAFLLGITDLGITLDPDKAIQVMEYARNNVSQVSTVIKSGSIVFLDLPALTLRVSRIENKIIDRYCYIPKA